MSFSFFDFVNQDSGSSKIKSIAKGIKGVGVKVGFQSKWDKDGCDMLCILTFRRGTWDA